MQVNHALIGSFPSMEAFRFTLEDQIAEFNTSQDPARRAAIGVVLDLSAQHFYGIDVYGENMSIREVIDAIEGAEQELQFA